MQSWITVPKKSLPGIFYMLVWEEGEKRLTEGAVFLFEKGMAFEASGRSARVSHTLSVPHSFCQCCRSDTPSEYVSRMECSAAPLVIRSQRLI